MILLVVVFRAKKRIKSVENKIFHILAIENIIVIITEIALQISLRYYKGENMASIILGRLYLIGVFIWFCIFSMYTYYITRYKKIENEEYKEKYYNLVKNIIYILMISISILFLILPISIMNDNNSIYSYGTAVDILKLFLGLGLLFWLVLLITDRKNIRNKEYAPIIIVIIFLSINVVLQTANPSILIATFTMIFGMYIMFFTIENPDLKMISELKVAREHAEKANKAKTDFLSSMSHEIRTPLNAIVGFSECIMNSDDMTEAQENAKDIVSASETLLEIVNGILDISKIETGKLEIINSKYNARETFMELAKLMSTRMKEKGLNFTYYIAPDVPDTLYGDHANVKKVVTNLLSNSYKYTDKGFVRFEVNCVNFKDYTRLIISVEDSGRGIKKENVNKMFAKFKRLEEYKNSTIEGTGLGLAITKQLTELMGGKIIVHTVYKEGSRFTIVLNQKIAQPDVVKTEDAKDTLDLKDVKILLVDDVPLNIKVGVKVLERYHANQIDTCDSGFACLDRIKAGNKYDLILLDDMMPKMSGVTTLHMLREIPGFNIPTIAITANAITGMREKYLQDGFDDFLAKPIEKEELIKVLNRVLGRSNVVQVQVETKEENLGGNEVIPVDDYVFEDIKANDRLHTQEEITQKESTKIETKTETKNDDIMKVEELNKTHPKYDVSYLEKNGVDINKSIDLLGDMEMYNSTIEEYRNGMEDRWNKLVQYKEQKDMENYAIDVHALKSDCKYLGFTTLADIAYSHELKSKEKDINYIEEHFEELEKEFNRVKEIVNNYNNK